MRTQIIIAALVLGLILSLVFAQSQRTAAHQVRSRADTLYVQAKEWERRAHAERQRADSLETRIDSAIPSPIDNVALRALRERGSSDPVADLIADLVRHPELIPAADFHGGRGMRFHDRDRIRVLSDRWVYAPFDDGHIGGELLLEYAVKPPGKLTWRVLEVRSPDQEE